MEPEQELQEPAVPARGGSGQALPVAAAWVTVALLLLAFWYVAPDRFPLPLEEFGVTRDRAGVWLRVLAGAEAVLLLVTGGSRRALLRGLGWTGRQAARLLAAVAARRVRIVDDAGEAPSPGPAARGIREVPESLGPGLPPFSLLSVFGAASGAQAEAEALAAQVPAALEALGVAGVQVLNAQAGPQAALVLARLPAEVRASALAALSEDLGVALGTEGVRVTGVAGRPGCVRLEFPLRKRRMVSLLELAPALAEVEAGEAPLLVGLSVDGAPVVSRFSHAAHVLVAGETGGGKSVYLHGLIQALLLSRRPEELRLVLIDPKQVEMSVYEDIPHLLRTVVTDIDEAAEVLDTLTHEMDRRYNLFRVVRVRDIAAFNAKAGGGEALPRIVCVVDEFADLLMSGKKEDRERAEGLIQRLAQKARAAGIHLVLATQRPTANVVTGNIKANVPTRIAFAVASEVDSRVILDRGGAEALGGRGDGLAIIAGRRPVRFQAPFLSEESVERVVAWWRDGRGDAAAPRTFKIVVPEPEQAKETPDASGQEGEKQDPLYEEAARYLCRQGSASVRILKKGLAIRTDRAVALLAAIDANEGWLGAARRRDLPRPVLLTPAQRERRMRGERIPPEEITGGAPA